MEPLPPLRGGGPAQPVGGGLPLSPKRRPLSARPRRNAPPIAPPTGCHPRACGDPSLTARHPSRPSWPGEDPGMTIDGPNASAHRRAPPTGCHPSESWDPALTLRQRMNGSQPCARMTPADASHPVQNPISLTRGVTSNLRPHTPISAQLTHGPWHRAYTPLTASSSSDSRRTGEGAGPGGARVASHPAGQSGSCGHSLARGPAQVVVMIDHHRGADGRIVAPSPPERRRASTQGSHLSPLTVRAPGSRGGTQGPLLRRTNRLDPWSRLAAPLPTGRRSIPQNPGAPRAARRARSIAFRALICS